MLRIGDRVQWSFFGKTGDTGTVLRVFPRPKRPQPGGVRAMVEVRWDANGYVGRVEDRKLKCLGKVVKTCKCGRSFSSPEWSGLRHVGEQVTESERLVYRLEMRNCPCGSTIGIERRQRKTGAVLKSA